ncbi:uncharacterized protein ACHE_80461S [Aspergillus chevalieri]|uniref:Uncharacterized protein n=1 Tax=Aspergillus chevalieri TaxID=182096 RepID=A0A7R7VXG7_ASPCH|nr:uncharacterized protein ACHE_80461S [Aspergillus chevalieri]BCR92561.1 hypothetical protein ACHE_80461S [Aspergillus chevalieri]
MSVPEQNTYPETPEHSTTSPHDSAPHFSDLDPISRCDIQDDTDIPIEPPAFWGDSAENALSSPSISSSDDSLEEFFRLPDAQDDIPSTRQSLATTGLGRMAASSNLSHKPTTSSIQRRLAHILTLHPFFTAHLTIIEVPVKRLVARMVMLKQVTTLTFMIINNCTPPNITPIPTLFLLMVSVGTITSVDSQKAPSGRRNNQTGELTNGFEFHQCCRPGRIPSRFVLTSCLPHLTIVCNSFLGYSKVLYHIACLTLHRQRVKREMRWQPVAQVPHMRLNKISVIVERSEEAPERICHGPWKRRAFC